MNTNSLSSSGHDRNTYRKPYRGGSYRGGGGRSRNNFSRRSGGRGYKPCTIDPCKYVAQAHMDPSCSIYDTTVTFDDFELASIIHENIRKKGYTKTTKIQAQTIPASLSGSDILGLARTGSGKTAAFLIPMIHKSLSDRDQRCLIITPTRELANQIMDEFQFFSNGASLKAALVIGGANMRRQIDRLKKDPQFVIATPGRLKDLEQRKRIDLSQFNNIVLDEVDRMLDMGFVHDIKLIISKLRKEKQSLFFSATMNPKIEEIARSFLNNPVNVHVKEVSLQRNVEQDIIKVPPERKLDTLETLLLKKDEFKKVLIFSRTKWGSDTLSKKLSEKGFNVESIHGGKTQSRRETVIMKFREDKISILVATDVAARGLDIDDITHVINFDEPGTFDDYIHRIGRTGRAGKIGNALTFVSR